MGRNMPSPHSTPRPPRRGRTTNHPLSRGFFLSRSPRVEAQLLRHLGPKARVLEIGGGLGENTDALLAHTRVNPSNYVMMDIKYPYPENLEYDPFVGKTQHVPKMGGDLARSPFVRKETFDTILATHTFNAWMMATSPAWRRRLKKRMKHQEKNRMRVFGREMEDATFSRNTTILEAVGLADIMTEYLPLLKPGGNMLISQITTIDMKKCLTTDYGYWRRFPSMRRLRAMLTYLEEKRIATVSFENREFFLHRKK